MIDPPLPESRLTPSTAGAGLRFRWQEWGRCLGASCGLHGLLLGGLLLASWRGPSLSATLGQISTVVESGDQADGPEEIVTAEDHLPRVQPMEIGAVSMQELIRSTLQRQMTASQDRQTDQQVSDLQAAAERLQQISDEESVTEMSRRVSQSLRLQPRADSQAATGGQNDPRNFDYSTSQLQDARAVTDEAGIVTYWGEMVDQRGCSITVELPNELGERLVPLFETMRRFPLLEQVYRQVVMSLLDSLSTTTERADN